MSEIMRRALDELRWEPTEKRVRATLGDDTVFDTTHAVLVWEPRRVVPSYAIPEEDINAELVSDETLPREGHPAPVLHPGIPFSVHSAEGQPVSLRLAGADRGVAGFRPAERELAGHVIVDFDGLDAWYEEEDQLFAHAHDPFARIEILRSSRHVRIELDGVLLAESSRGWLLFETQLPLRFYLPREALRGNASPSPKRTWCAYKGQASYWSFDVNGTTRENLAWTYEEPLRGAEPIRGHVAFFDELVDVIVDGELRERPGGSFSKTILDEARVVGQTSSATGAA